MTSKNRNLAVTAGTVVALALVLWNIIPGPASTPVAKADPTIAAASTPPSTTSPLPASSSTPLTDPVADGGRSYSIALHELSGLTQSTPPGTHIEIWAAWDSGSSEPHVQRLLKDVVVEKIEPPFLPEGPTEVVLSLAAHQAKRMFWGDKYANLGAIVIE